MSEFEQQSFKISEDGVKASLPNSTDDLVGATQQNLQVNVKGEVSIGEGDPIDNEEDLNDMKRKPARSEKGRYEVDKISENLFCFTKETFVYAYAKARGRYMRFLLKNNINAYVVEEFKNAPKGKRRCYCFDENLDNQTDYADLYLNNYSEKLSNYFPYFFANKSDAKKARKSNRLIQPS